MQNRTAFSQHYEWMVLPVVYVDCGSIADGKRYCIGEYSGS